MGTQSSIATLLRGMVMLGCLLIIPLLALFGTSLPDTARQFLQQQLGIHLGANGAQAATTASPATAFVAPNWPAAPNVGPANMAPFTPTSPAVNVVASMPTAALAVTAPMPKAALGATAPMPNAVPAELPTNPPGLRPIGSSGAPSTSDPAIVATSYTSPSAASPAPPDANHAAPLSLEQMVAKWRQNEVPAATPGKTALAADSAVASCGMSAAANDRFTQIHHRLRELGATYYVLEVCGPQGEKYRFYCKMGIGGSANFTRHFEATESDPLAAMQRVLQDVEAWRGGRM